MHPAHLIHVFEHRAYPLEKETFLVGRGEGNDVMLRSPNVSRRHLEIRRSEQDEFLLVPIGSGGVRVNGTPIHGEVPLTDGDNIGVGYETFIFTTGPLPLGAAIVDHLHPPDPADPETRRPTIVHTALTDPELRSAQEERRRRVLGIVLVGVAVLALVVLIVTR